jgi:SOS-response transcriptional repressor LexA
VKKGELLTVDHGRPGAFLPPRAKKAPLINPEEAIARRFTQIGQISLPSFMHPGGGAFAMNVPDDAMAGAGVSQNDVIVANRSADGQPGFLAVIQVKRELLVRRVESRAGRLVAVSVPRSGRRESHRVSKKSIRGRVTGLLRDYKGT